MNTPLFNEVSEERSANKLCSNFKCVKPIQEQTKFTSIIQKIKTEPKQKRLFCENKACSDEYEK